MLTADNFEALHASRLSEEIEGVDIDPASVVGSPYFAYSAAAEALGAGSTTIAG